METKEKKSPQQEAAEIRKKFAQRKKECVDISIKLKSTIDLLEHVAKFDDVNEVNENGLGKINLHDYIWNILIWYPKQSVPFIVDRITPLFEEAKGNMRNPHPLVGWLSGHISNTKLFRFIVRMFPISMKRDILRIRTIDKCSKSLTRLKAMLNDEEDGQRINVLMLAQMVSFAHILFPRRTSEFVAWIIELYKKCQKVNANQIMGFSRFSKDK